MPRRPQPVPDFLRVFLAHLLEQGGLSPSSSARYVAEIGRYFRARPANAGPVTGDELWAYILSVGSSNPQGIALFAAAWARFRAFAADKGTSYPSIPSKEDRDRQWREAAFAGLEAQLTTLAVRIPRAHTVLAGLAWDSVARTESGFTALTTDAGELVVAPDATDALEAIRASQPADSKWVMQTNEGRALTARDVAGLLEWAGAPTEGELAGLFAARDQ